MSPIVIFVITFNCFSLPTFASGPGASCVATIVIPAERRFNAICAIISKVTIPIQNSSFAELQTHTISSFISHLQLKINPAFQLLTSLPNYNLWCTASLVANKAIESSSKDTIVA
jgi:hypothetical protein